MTDYSIIPDSSLVMLLREGEADAGSELAGRYRPMVKRLTRPYFIVGGDSEDLIQEGMIGLIGAMQSFDENAGVSFQSYAEVCIKRRVLSAIKAANRFKHMPLNYRLSLEELYSSENDAPFSVSSGQYEHEPERLFIRQEEKNSIYELCNTLLTPLEKRVLSLYLQGLSYEDIAAGCGKTEKSVDSALQRIKKKLARLQASVD